MRWRRIFLAKVEGVPRLPKGMGWDSMWEENFVRPMSLGGEKKGTFLWTRCSGEREC